ncbi:MAG: alpha/beta hydrolase [Clostridiales bacterium]|nr:alpha/beta hydrolase [Clostridiales bacterium]
MKAVLIIVCGAAVLFVLALLAVGYYMFKVITSRPDPAKKAPETEERYIQREKDRERDKKILFNHPSETVSVNTADGLVLRGWYFPSGKETKRFVIFSHGHKCNGPDEFAHIIPLYLEELGYNILLPDHRAHGRSDGKYIGFSVLDSKDILLWVDYLTKRFGDDIEIIMHGASMGGATVLLANESDKIQPQVKLIVDDCGFSNAKEELCLGIKDTFGFRFDILFPFANFFCKLLAKYSFTDSNALKNINKSKNPILFIHGEEDTYVPTYMSQQLYDACDSVKKDILIVKDAVHVFSYYTAPDLYKAKVKEFIKNTIGDENIPATTTEEKVD